MIKKDNLYIVMYSMLTAYWFVKYIYVNSGLNTAIVCNIMLIIGLLSFIPIWIFAKFSLKEVIIQAVLLGFLVYVYFMSGAKDNGILTIFLGIVAVKNVDIRKITKTMFYTLLILFILLLILTLIGVVPYSTYQKTDAFGNTHNMIKLAKQHGNPHYIVVFNIIALYLYTYYKKVDLKRCFILQVLVLLFYAMFSSRTGIILATLSIWGVFIIKKRSNKTYKENKIINMILKNSYLIMFLFVYIMGTFCYETSFFNFVNKLVSSRIYEAYYYFENVGIGLLPKAVKYYYICDNSQTYMMVNLGMIFVLIYVILNYKTISNLIKRRKMVEVFFLILFLIYSYSEVVFLKPFSNFSMLFLIYAFYPNREVDDNGESKELPNNMCS